MLTIRAADARRLSCKSCVLAIRETIGMTGHSGAIRLHFDRGGTILAFLSTTSVTAQ